jgi:low affinity Fe/Cu permease
MFRKIAHVVSEIMGSSYAFFAAALIILVWFYFGPVYNYSNTWQLIINTGTTIVTFLMVFLIQNTQNRDTKAINLKLDELIQSNKKARNQLIDIEDDTDEVLNKLEGEYKVSKNKI